MTTFSNFATSTFLLATAMLLFIRSMVGHFSHSFHLRGIETHLSQLYHNQIYNPNWWWAWSYQR